MPARAPRTSGRAARALAALVAGAGGAACRIDCAGEGCGRVVEDQIRDRHAADPVHEAVVHLGDDAPAAARQARRAASSPTAAGTGRADGSRSPPSSRAARPRRRERAGSHGARATRCRSAGSGSQCGQRSPPVCGCESRLRKRGIASSRWSSSARTSSTDGTRPPGSGSKTIAQPMCMCEHSSACSSSRKAVSSGVSCSLFTYTKVVPHGVPAIRSDYGYVAIRLRTTTVVRTGKALSRGWRRAGYAGLDQMGERTMYGRIILGHDGTEQSSDALALARLLASGGNRSIVVSHIIPRPRPYDAKTREYVQLVHQHDHSVLDPALAELAGLKAEGRALESRSPARGLHELAEDEGASLIVIGSTHRGPVGRVVLGSVGEILLAGTPVGGRRRAQGICRPGAGRDQIRQRGVQSALWRVMPRCAPPPPGFRPGRQAARDHRRRGLRPGTAPGEAP